MQLTPHFTLAELTVTRTGIANDPGPHHVCALTALCSAVLEPLRERWRGPVRVTSGFRSEAVNAAVKGSRTSQHMRGEAADVIPPGDRVTAYEEARIAMLAGLPIDQLIIYEAAPHLHVSHTARYTARRQALVCLADGSYQQWHDYDGALKRAGRR